MKTLQLNKKSNVEVKVLAINTLYEYAALIVEHERKHFSQFIGKDIFKVDGSIKAKYVHEKLSFKGQLQDGTWYDVHSWLSKEYSSLNVTVKVCINGGSYDVQPNTAFCQYEQISTLLFNVDNNCLVATERDYTYLEVRYNVEELTKIANDVKEAAQIYKDATDKMPYIFKDVFYIERLTRN